MDRRQTRKRLLAAVAWLGAAASPMAADGCDAVRFALIRSGTDGNCATFAGPPLAQPPRIWIAAAGGAAPGRVVRPAAGAECPGTGDESSGSSYLLEPAGRSYAVPVAIAGVEQLSVEADGLQLFAGGASCRIRIRQCASGEGLHLTAWSREDAAPRRLWHAYLYLGYDLVPDCRPEEM